MARRRENMLEALQASADQPPSHPAGGIPPVRAASEPHVTTAQGVTLPLGTVPFLFLQLGLVGLVFAIGYLAGQGSAPALAAEGDGEFELQAPGASDPGGSGLPVAAPLTTQGPDEAGGPVQGSSPAEVAFMDPSNKYTVVVFTAENSDFGKNRAWAIHDYLVNQSYPVVHPHLWKGEVKIFVGAAPTTGGLADLEARLRKDLGPDGTRPFYDAYVDNADRFR